MSASVNDPQSTVRTLLRNAGSELSRLDAELLLAHVLGSSRTALYTRSDQQPEPDQVRRFQDLVARRRQGEPLAYLTGRREFWSLMFSVTPATLIPRPETELLVEQALALVTHPDQPLDIADLGTGSGAIAIALACELPNAKIIATEFSPAAIEIACANAAQLCPDRIEFRSGDWCAALGSRLFDLIVANPPYVAAADPALQGDGVRFEPGAALASGPDGLNALRQIIGAAHAYLKPGGRLLLEHGAGQAEAVAALLSQQGYRDITLCRDLAGLPRVSAAVWQVE